MNIFYLHWNEQELKERVKTLKKAGHSIQAHWSAEESPSWKQSLPDMFIISLDRLPSHGREYASWVWEAKKRQHIPIIFVDGEAAKVEATRTKFPNAVYCTSKELLDTINKLSVIKQ